MFYLLFLHHETLLVTFSNYYMEIYSVIAFNKAKAIVAAPKPPDWGAHTAQKRFQVKTQSCINSKTKFCFENRVEWDFLRSGSLFQFGILPFRFLLNSSNLIVVVCFIQRPS